MSAINTTYYSQLLSPAAEFAIGALASIPVSWAFTVLHENAHVFMANRLFKNAKPITTYGSLTRLGLDATTQYSIDSGPSRLGKWLGSSYSHACIDAAGPLGEIISILAITILTRLDKHAARLMLANSLSLVYYSLTPLIAAGKKHGVSIISTHGNDFYDLMVHGGKAAYGLLALASLSTAGLVFGNAFGFNQMLPNQASNSTSDLSCLA